ncbi:MAG: DUF92 domain-containing protein [Promethearchaeota archaeon]
MTTNIIELFVHGTLQDHAFALKLANFFILLVLGVALNAMLMIWAIKHSHLTRKAGIVSFFIGLILWSIDLVLFFTIILFFISSSILTKFHKSDKIHVQDKFAKTGMRDTYQVLANGMAALIFSITYKLFDSWSTDIFLEKALYTAIITSIATVNADTWATEIGVLSKANPRWILNPGMKVEPGTSGGITLLGSIAGLLGSSLIAIFGLGIGITVGSIPVQDILEFIVTFSIISLIGFGGTMIDSVLGATIQGFFKCKICQKHTEKRVHCGEKTELVRGKAGFNNDLVNFTSASFSAVIAFILVFLFKFVFH